MPTFTTSNERMLLLLADGASGMLRVEDAERLQVGTEALHAGSSAVCTALCRPEQAVHAALALCPRCGAYPISAASRQLEPPGPLVADAPACLPVCRAFRRATPAPAGPSRRQVWARTARRGGRATPTPGPASAGTCWVRCAAAHLPAKLPRGLYALLH